MQLPGRTASYPSGFLGQYRFHVDCLEIFFVEASKCNAIFLLTGLGLLFFTVDQDWSPVLFLSTIIGGVFISTIFAIVQVNRQMPRPKFFRTLGVLLFSLVFEILWVVAVGLYIAACLIQRQFNMRAVMTLVKICLLFPALALIYLTVMRTCIQARFIPSSTMEPNLQINDRLLTENISNLRGIPIERGQIVMFYAPAIMGDTVNTDLPTKLGELTGLPFFPNRTAYIKRVVGIANDRIQMRAGDGTYINGKKVEEASYTLEPATYNLEKLSDIKGPSADGSPIQPYTSDAPIVVPPNMVFVLGDNRNNSIDSHIFGFVDQKQIIGRGWALHYPEQFYIHKPFWHRPLSK